MVAKVANTKGQKHLNLKASYLCPAMPTTVAFDPNWVWRQNGKNGFNGGYMQNTDSVVRFNELKGPVEVVWLTHTC